MSIHFFTLLLDISSDKSFSSVVNIPTVPSEVPKVLNDRCAEAEDHLPKAKLEANLSLAKKDSVRETFSTEDSDSKNEDQKFAMVSEAVPVKTRIEPEAKCLGDEMETQSESVLRKAKTKKRRRRRHRKKAVPSEETVKKDGLGTNRGGY